MTAKFISKKKRLLIQLNFYYQNPEYWKPELWK